MRNLQKRTNSLDFDVNTEMELSNLLCRLLELAMELHFLDQRGQYSAHTENKLREQYGRARRLIGYDSPHKVSYNGSVYFIWLCPNAINFQIFLDRQNDVKLYPIAVQADHHHLHWHKKLREPSFGGVHDTPCICTRQAHSVPRGQVRFRRLIR